MDVMILKPGSLFQLVWQRDGPGPLRAHKNAVLGTGHLAKITTHAVLRVSDINYFMHPKDIHRTDVETGLTIGAFSVIYMFNQLKLLPVPLFLEDGRTLFAVLSREWEYPGARISFPPPPSVHKAI